MKARYLTALTVAAVLIASAPVATAQAPHKDPSTGGTTGLFTVPVAAVLAPGKFAINFSYVADAFQPGDSNIETLAVAGSFVFAAAENLEVFGSIEPRVGVNRKYRVQRAAGISTDLAPRLDDHPFATESWRTGFGDIRIGAKYRIAGEVGGYDGLAILGEIKLPTSDTDAGIGTGKVDASIGLVVSAEAAEMIGISSFLGGTFRASPDEFDLGNEFNYGVGLQVPTRTMISAIIEATGTLRSNPDPVAVGAGVVAGDDPVFIRAGLRASAPMGIALDAGYVYNANFNVPDGLAVAGITRGGWLAKLSYTNDRSEPVIFTGAAPLPLPPVNRPPTITCRAERTDVRAGESVRLVATVNDPDGDEITVIWNTQAGSITPRQGETVTWSSQGVRPGSGPVNVRASDGYGGTADCQLTLSVSAPPPPPEDRVLTFSCSEFPSGNTRVDNRCKAILDDVALQLRQNPRATAVITGHSDSTGSDETNNAMSLERADNAEAYLVDTHGINTTRIDTASAGSSEPIADNITAEGRLQNRRIVAVVTIPAQ